MCSQDFFGWWVLAASWLLVVSGLFSSVCLLSEVKQNAEFWKHFLPRAGAIAFSMWSVQKWYRSFSTVWILETRALAEGGLPVYTKKHPPEAGQSSFVLFMVLWFLCCLLQLLWVPWARREQSKTSLTCTEATANHFRSSYSERYWGTVWEEDWGEWHIEWTCLVFTRTLSILRLHRKLGCVSTLLKGRIACFLCSTACVNKEVIIICPSQVSLMVSAACSRLFASLFPGQACCQGLWLCNRATVKMGELEDQIRGDGQTSEHTGGWKEVGNASYHRFSSNSF